MSSVSYPDRLFQLWEYRVSHGGLMIRSPRGPNTSTNVDLIFDGVELLCCARILRGLELVRPEEGDVAKVYDFLGELAGSDGVFVFASEGVRHIVVASSFRVVEHEGDIFDSPF